MSVKNNGTHNLGPNPLGNPRHEKFAQELSTGITITEAYKRAGYSNDRGNAARLSRKRDVNRRVTFLKSERENRIRERARAPAKTEGFETLADMGIDQPWLAGQYKKIAENAQKAERFNDAIKALDSLKQMVNTEETKNTAAISQAPAEKLDIAALGTILDKVTGLVSASKQPDAATGPAPEQIGLSQAEFRGLRAHDVAAKD